MSKYVIAAEVAEEEFLRFCECMDIEVDSDDKEQREVFKESKRKFTIGVRKGIITVSPDGSEVTVETHKQPITFKEPTGATFNELDKVAKQSGSQILGVYASMGQLTSTSPTFFSNMPQRYLKYATAVITLLLGE